MTEEELTQFLDRLGARMFGVGLVLVFVVLILAALG